MIKAIVWDFDGTLIDTRVKNLNVTKAILQEVTQKADIDYSALASVDAYDQANYKYPNWKELYHKEFSLSESDIDYAGSLWTKYQLLDTTNANFYDGITSTIKELKHYQHGIVSQNSKQNILKRLEEIQVAPYFNYIVGYEEVSFSKQKPHPEGLLHCVSQIANITENDFVIYIGDHETDAHCAFNANYHLNRKTVVSVGAFYEKQDLSFQWRFKPDYAVNKLTELTTLIKAIEQNFIA